MKTAFRLMIAVTLVVTATLVHAEPVKSGGIAWYGTWKGGLAEAKRSGRPILLLSAAPHCRNISGIW